MAIDYSLYNLLTFNPYTFEELAKPLDRYKEYYEENEKALSEFGTKLAEIESLLSLETDPNTIKLLESYKEALQKQVNAMNAFGINSSIRQGNLNLKNDYARMITPIANAIDKRKEEAKLQLEFKMKNPTIRFSRDAGTSSLDYYMGNPNGGFDSVTGEEIAKQTSLLASKFAESEIQSPEYSKLMNDLYYGVLIKKGVPLSELLLVSNSRLLDYDWRLKNPDKAKEEYVKFNLLQKAILNIADSVRNLFATNKAYNDAWASPYIKLGLYSAVGKSDFNLTQNRDLERVDAHELAVAQILLYQAHAKYYEEYKNLLILEKIKVNQGDPASWKPGQYLGKPIWYDALNIARDSQTENANVVYVLGKEGVVLTGNYKEDKKDKEEEDNRIVEVPLDLNTTFDNYIMNISSKKKVYKLKGVLYYNDGSNNPTAPKKEVRKGDFTFVRLGDAGGNNGETKLIVRDKNGLEYTISKEDVDLFNFSDDDIKEYEDKVMGEQL